MAKIYENGIVREMTDDESFATERKYWRAIQYDEAVNAEIRKQYDESQEFAILRQKDEKPDEYSAYYAYCEECKAYVKEQIEKYT